jgi:hypothetical protein
VSRQPRVDAGAARGWRATIIGRRFATVLAVVALTAAAAAPAALAVDRSAQQAAGWGCGADVGLPAGHCITPGTVKNFDAIVARGGTFQLLVFDEDGDFLTAEIATFKASADGRPCPHDDDARNTDGTYWEFVPGLYVCHHRSG